MSETNMNHQWSNEASKIIESLKNTEKLKYIKRTSNEGSKNFLRCPSEFPKFDYELFLNEEEQSLSSVIYFGTHIEGPPNCVHGGAIASIIDAQFGTLLWLLNKYCVTVNLNVNYKKFVPLNTEVQFKCNLEKIEGRKIFVKGELRSLDGSILHDESSGIFIILEKK